MRSILNLFSREQVVSKLCEVFKPYIDIDIKIFEEFYNYGQVMYYKKNSVIKSSGEVDNFLRIVLVGSIGVFFKQKNEEKCIYLSLDGDLACDYNSFYYQRPSQLELNALENTILFQISKSNFEEFTESFAEAEIARRFIVEILLCDSEQRYQDLLCLDAEERFIKLMERYPNINQRISQKQVASLLGITPQSLCRIKRNFIKNKKD